MENLKDIHHIHSQLYEATAAWWELAYCLSEG